MNTTFSHLSHADLLAEVKRVASLEKQTTAELIALLMELDIRQLYKAEGCASLFTYCTQVLHFSESAAYGRIEAARVVRRCPSALARLADGRLTLTTVGLLAPIVTPDNAEKIFDAVAFKSKREVQQLIANWNPIPDVPTTIRRVPKPGPVTAPAEPVFLPPRLVPPTRDANGSAPVDGQRAVALSTATAKRPSTIAPLGGERFMLKVTLSAETHAKLRRAQDLLRHVVPNGDPAVVLDRALTRLIGDLERTKLGKADRPRTTASAPSAAIGRHIPAAVRRAVWARDQGRCAFVGTEGRCIETAFLELHHLEPFAAGGPATADNLSLRCRSHNAYEARMFFGAEVDANWVRT